MLNFNGDLDVDAYGGVTCEQGLRSFTLYLLRTFGGGGGKLYRKASISFFHYAHIWEQNWLTSKNRALM